MKALVAQNLRCPKTKKAAYVDEPTALRYSNIIMKQGGYDGKMPRRAYRCKDCGWWHLTSR